MALLTLAVAAADSATVRAPIISPSSRKAAPVFDLLDSSGKHARLSDYLGTPVVLNLWATECGGCVLEIPTFVQMNESHGGKELKVVGISMDISYEGLKDSNEAWGKVRPFVAARDVKYQILMGNEEIEKLYKVEALPITHLLDRRGRIAATYIGIVNPADLEANIRALLAEGK
jgi:peroxiredoxin